jgi:MFS family permease
MKTKFFNRRGFLTFMTVWFGQLVSTLGSGLTSFALGVWIYEKTGSTTLFMINFFVWILPYVILSPVAGIVADRRDRRLIMILSDTGAGLSTLFIMIVFVVGDLHIWHVYVASFLNSAFSVFQWPSYSAATTQLVPKEHLGRAGGMTQIGEAISRLASPAMGGALYVTAGLGTILFLDLFSYFIALTTLASIRFPKLKITEESRREKKPYLKEVMYGWVYIGKRPGLFRLLWIFAGMNFVLNITQPLLTPMMLDMTSPDIVGYVGSITGVGMLVGTLVMSFWGGPKRRIFGIFGSELIVGLMIILAGLRPNILLIAVAHFFLMLAEPITNGCSQAIWQTKVAPDVQGRVFSIRSMIAYSIIPLSYMVAGPLSDRVFIPLLTEGGVFVDSLGKVFGVGSSRGIGLMFAVFGLIYVFLASSIILIPTTRRLEIDILDAVPETDTTSD